ncbi:MAG: hypothetical protein GY950_30220 [bacterium]|nr:hypothetical protein [bacterium]
MKAKLFVIFVILMLLSGFLQFKHDTHTNYAAQKKVFVTLPSGKTLRILSFGFQDLVADMLFIWSIQFYSTYHLNNRFDYLEQIYNTITDLAPHYVEPYIVGSWIMALEVKDVEMAIRLLRKGSRTMKDQWIFDFECAYYAYKELKDYHRADAYLKRALQRPGVPKWLTRRRAHMVYMKDDLTEAYAMWMEIKKNAKTILEKDAAFKHLYQIKSEMDRKMLTEKTAQYKERYGRYPTDISRLVRVGLLKEIPLDFTGQNYLYDSKTGKISAIRMFEWKKRR